MSSRKPTATARTFSLFEGVKPGEAPPPPRDVRGGYEERPGQVGMFGPMQLEIGDRERLARDAERKASMSYDYGNDRAGYERDGGQARGRGAPRSSAPVVGPRADGKASVAERDAWLLGWDKAKPTEAESHPGNEPGDARHRSTSRPAKKRRVKRDPTAASIAKQSTRLAKASEATAEADALEEKARKALADAETEQREGEAATKTLKKRIEALKSETRSHLASAKHWKKEAAKFTAKAKVARAKARKLASA